jgi:hypothetical protein
MHTGGTLRGTWPKHNLIKSKRASDVDSNEGVVLDRYKMLYITSDGDTWWLGLFDQDVYITVGASSMTVKLPSVAEANGRSYKITVVSAGVGKSLTLARFNSDASSWTSDYTLDTDGDNITLRSDGQKWNVISNNIAV